MDARKPTILIGMGLIAAGVWALGTGSEVQQTTSVKPGINDTWKSPDIGPLVQRLEAEDREIWTERVNLAAVAGPRPGDHVADVGAGSGFMSEQFSKLVGPQGKVYAVDINATMMERVARRARQIGLENLETITCDERSVGLPDHSVDMIFICDTYHHFEYPAPTMRTVHQALKSGGQLVIVDFDRIPGRSPDWVLEHVRADRDTVVEEIENAGFELTNVHDMPFLKNNYVLRFRKVDR